MAQKKVALITGGSRGIGRGCALALAAHGWDIAVNYAKNQQAATEVVRLAAKSGVQAAAFQGDIARAQDRQQLVAAVSEKFSRIDALVNNAGIAPVVRQDMLQLSEADFDTVMAVNLRGTFFLTQQVAQKMIALVEAGRLATACIINIGSLSAYTSSTDRAEYCISKAGLSMATKLFADRLAAFGIRVYEIRPGIIKTEMTRPAKAKYDQLLQKGFTPLNRWGTPDDVARAVVALVEGAFPFSTGEVFDVDGGFHLRRL